MDQGLWGFFYQSLKRKSKAWWREGKRERVGDDDELLCRPKEETRPLTPPATSARKLVSVEEGWADPWCLAIFWRYRNWFLENFENLGRKKKVSKSRGRKTRNGRVVLPERNECTLFENGCWGCKKGKIEITVANRIYHQTLQTLLERMISSSFSF